METKPKVKIVYKKLQERLDRNTNSAPAAAPFFESSNCFSATTARSWPRPCRCFPASLEDIAARAGESPARAQALLDSMADRGIVMDMPDMKAGKTFYYLLPPVSFLRVFHDERARRYFSEAAVRVEFHSYENDSDAFAQSLFGGPSKLGRVASRRFGGAKSIRSEILDYSAHWKSSTWAETASPGVVLLPPQDATFGQGMRQAEGTMHVCRGAAEYFIRHGIAAR